MNGRYRIGSLLLVGACALVSGVAAGGTTAGPPPRAGFTAAVRADAAETSTGQNEPQVTVDQSGTAYVTWQSGQNGSGTSKTRDGTHFTYLGYPDPATPNSGIGTGDIGDVTIAPSSFPNPVQNTTADTKGKIAKLRLREEEDEDAALPEIEPPSGVKPPKRDPAPPKMNADLGTLLQRFFDTYES